MAHLASIGVQAVADASVSDLLAHWIAEQQQRDGLCQRERPRIGILAAQGTCEMEDGLPIVEMRPPCRPSWRPEAFPASFRRCP